MRYNEEVVRSVMEANDLVELISQFVTLKKSGRNYMGCCPFHNEKTPSFSVSPDKQLYHCFGCGESGNIVSFVEKMENMRFPEAIEYLAERSGVNLPKIFDPQEEAKLKKKQKIVEMHRQAANHYFRHLKKNPRAQKYLTQRGYSLDTIRHFGMGVSTGEWQDLVRLFTKGGFTETEMMESGLVLKGKNGRLYDRFRNRVMIPIQNIQDKIIGFGGRTYLTDQNQGAKYLNSPETMAFSKSYELFNLNHAKKVIENERLIIVEGFMDVLALWQHGIQNVVANLGTAFTPYHAKTLSRYVKEVILCFDGDAAGENATKKAIEVLRKSPLNVRIIRLDIRDDPDSYIQKHGADAFKKVIDKAVTITDFELSLLEKQYDLNYSDGKVKYLNGVLTCLRKISNPIEQEFYIRKIADSANISQELLLREARKKQGSEMTSEMSEMFFQSDVRIPKAYREAQEIFLQMMLENRDKVEGFLSVEDFSPGVYQRLYRLMISDKEKKPCSLLIGALQNEEDKKLLTSLALRGKDITNELLEESWTVIKKYRQQEKERAIVNRIRLEKDDEENSLRQLDALAKLLKK